VTPFAASPVRTEFVNRALPSDDLIFEPHPVRRDVSRFGKPACLLHTVKRGATDRDDLQDLLFVQHGEDRSSVSDVFGNVHTHCIELMAGRAAERMLLEADAAPPADDLRQARELAMLTCTSKEAIETFGWRGGCTRPDDLERPRSAYDRGLFLL
jgi:hypothetical protein